MSSLERPASARPGRLPHKDPERLGLPFTAWPQEDRAGWQQALEAGDLLSEGGCAAHWAPATRRKIMSTYGGYLGWLDRRGLLDRDGSPCARLSAELVTAYLQERRDQVTSATLLCSVADLRMFARVVYPDLDGRWLARLEAAIRQRGSCARDKRQRLRSVAELVALGEVLMRCGGEADFRDRQSQLAYRDGLMIALLALRPLRLRNFTALTLGQSLRRQGDSWWIVLSGEVTKNRQPLELPFPDRLVPALEGYLAHVRPLLLDGRIDQGQTQALWISLRATAMSPASVYEQITMRTARAFGHSMNPHLFRDCAATSMALADPSLVRAGAPLLGHASFATTERHYNLASAADAARRHHAVVQALRAAGGKRRR